jgi:hypothetical protein
MIVVLAVCLKANPDTNPEGPLIPILKAYPDANPEGMICSES